MKTAGALAVLLLAALFVPTASAQAADGITVVPGTLAAPIPYEGTGTMTVTGTVGCAEILRAMAGAMGPTATVTVSVLSPPAWLTFGDASTNLASQESVTDCAAGGGSRNYSVDLPLTVTKDAPGVVDNAIQLVATIGDTTSEQVGAVINVAYNVDYTITADATFPLVVNGPQASFNVTITQASNARSMVMIEEVSTSAGVFSGLGSQVYENDAGKPVSKTFQVTFKAPEAEWTNATASFTGFGHYLLLTGQAGEFATPDCKAIGMPECDADGTRITYAFVAGEGAVHEHAEEEEKKSPAPVGAFLALGLVALAALVRRKA